MVSLKWIVCGNVVSLIASLQKGVITEDLKAEIVNKLKSVS